MIAGRVASSAVGRQVRYVTPVPVGAATGLVRRVYSQIEEEMRLVVPPALLHSVAPQTLAAYWMLMREPLMPSTAIDRATKESVAAAVSVATICPYCVDMHSVSMYDLATEHDAEALAADRVADMADPRLREVSAWARTAHEAPGGAPLPAWVTPAQRAELIGTVVSLHYLSRTVNIFLSNFLLPPVLTGAPRRRFKRGIGRLMRPTLRAAREAGASLDLLPPAPVPTDAGWAAGNLCIAEAVARAGAVFEAAGERTLSREVRDIVHARLDGWRGEETGISTKWCEDLLAGLGEADRAAGRLALLTAVASHQVDAPTVAEFRRHQPSDAALVEAVAWAGFEAARRVGNRQSPDAGRVTPQTDAGHVAPHTEAARTAPQTAREEMRATSPT